MKTLILVGALVALCGCALFDADGDDCATLANRLDRLETQIDAEIGDAEALDVAACRVIPFGAKPCGGASTYLVYSATDSDPAEVQRLVGEYDRLDDRRNAACGLVSNCMIEPMPTAALEGERCVAVYGGS